MHLSVPWALALGLTPVVAFSDTSPFMFFSTAELLLDSPQITTADALTSSLSSTLRNCPSRYYVLLHQSGVRTDDYVEDGATPQLQQRIKGEDKHVRSSGSVAEVQSELDQEALEQMLRKECGAEAIKLEANCRYHLWDKAKDLEHGADGALVLPIEGISSASSTVVKASFSPPPTSSVERTLRLRENDLWLQSLVEALASNYTVLYTTSPRAEGDDLVREEPSSYQMDSAMSPLDHLELKRDVGAHDQATKNVTLVDGPLFERYQYLTPGIFMGLLVMLFLGSIMYVAVNAVASLQVTYAAFDKETGPSQQKKQQ